MGLGRDIAWPVLLAVALASGAISHSIDGNTAQTALKGFAAVAFGVRAVAQWRAQADPPLPA